MFLFAKLVSSTMDIERAILTIEMHRSRWAESTKTQHAIGIFIIRRATIIYYGLNNK
jgi:hypothetical protein